MAEKDVHYFDWVEYPHARVRVEMDIKNGIPSQFVIQLERLVDGDWREVVRFDHEPDNPGGHDVTEEGIHMDVYRDGKKVGVKDDFPTVPLTDAPAYCIRYIETNAEALLRRFDTWHNLTDRTNH